MQSGRMPREVSRRCAAAPVRPRAELGGPGVGDGRALGGPVLGREGGGREHRGCPARILLVQQTPQPGEGDEQIAEHAWPLAALPREEEGGPAGSLSFVAYVDAVAGDELPGLLQLPGQIVQSGGDHRDMDRPLTGGGLRGEIAQWPWPSRPVVLLQPGGEAVDGAEGGGPVRPSEAEQLGGPGVQAVGGLVLVPVTGKHRMVIGTSEAEGTHCRDAASGGLGPRPGLGVEAEGAAAWLPVGVGARQVQRRRPYPAVHGPCRLDQSGQARRTFRMAELRLDRTE